MKGERFLCLCFYFTWSKPDGGVCFSFHHCHSHAPDSFSQRHTTTPTTTTWHISAANHTSPAAHMSHRSVVLLAVFVSASSVLTLEWVLEWGIQLFTSWFQEVMISQTSHPSWRNASSRDREKPNKTNLVHILAYIIHCDIYKAYMLTVILLKSINVPVWITSGNKTAVEAYFARLAD